MARQESDREDLLAEGVNLPQRGRITTADGEHVWVLGWRKNTALSLFDDVDPVFQFNTAGQLRRVYFDGKRISTQDGRLTHLQKVADPSGRLAFRPVALTETETAEVLARLSVSIERIGQALQSVDTEIETVGIAAESFVARVRAWCEDDRDFQISATPNAE